jgi:hypothetical protein
VLNNDLRLEAELRGARATGNCGKLFPNSNQGGVDCAMPKFVIERDIPDVGKLSPEQLQAVSQTSCGVLQEMGPEIQWLHSYVTDDKIYCVYIAPDEDTVRRHAQQGGFPANRVSRVRSTIDPTTAE